MSIHEPRTETRRLLGPGDHGRAIGDDEFLAAEFEEAWRYELEGGKLIVMSPNSEEHDDATEPVRDHLVAYKLAHRDRVQKVVSEAWVRVRPGTYRIGDLAVYLVGDRAATRRPTRVPELIFEVVSPGAESEHRDYVEKRAEYHSIGVLEYVIIDPLDRRVLVLRRDPDRYDETVLSDQDQYTTPLLPGLAVPLAEVFPD